MFECIAHLIFSSYTAFSLVIFVCYVIDQISGILSNTFGTSLTHTKIYEDFIFTTHNFTKNDHCILHYIKYRWCAPFDYETSQLKWKLS